MIATTAPPRAYAVSPAVHRQAAEIGRFRRIGRSLAMPGRQSFAWLAEVAALETVSRQRAGLPSRRSRVKLTDAQVIEARASDETDAAMARRWGVARNTVTSARLGRTHKHLPGAMKPRPHYGVFQPHAKLSDAIVREIILSPLSKRATAARFNVGKTTVEGIWTDRTWKHVSREGAPQRTGKRPPRRRRENEFDDETVRQILASPHSSRKEAALRGASVTCIELIRRGLTYRHVSREGALSAAERRRLRASMKAEAA